jgi:hypothetical protein
MAAGDRREEVDTKIKEWERELEKLRLGLACAPEEAEAKYSGIFAELYRKKEIAKSRWEPVRGAYLPEAEAVRQFEKALGEMDAAWSAAQPMLAEILGRKPA